MTTTKKHQPDWTPVRKGSRYCSPSCGRGCTIEEFELAHLRAERLCATLNSMQGGFSDWLPHVWENSGWHYRARRNVSSESESVHTRSECDLHETLNEDGTARRFWCSIVISGHQFHNESFISAEDALIITMTEIKIFQQAFENSFARFHVLT